VLPHHAASSCSLIMLPALKLWFDACIIHIFTSLHHSVSSHLFTSPPPPPSQLARTPQLHRRQRATSAAAAVRTCPYYICPSTVSEPDMTYYDMLCNAALYWIHTPSSILTSLSLTHTSLSLTHTHISLSLSPYQMGCCLHVTVRVPSETAPTLYVRSSPPAVSPSQPQQH